VLLNSSCSSRATDKRDASLHSSICMSLKSDAAAA
jgi:hypothetical protein